MELRALIVIVAFLISACSSKVDPKIVQINKTHKVQSAQNWETAEELRFMWTPPKGPKGNDSKWIINDDIMLFTPDTPGEYSISLVVEDMSGYILGEESFLLKAEDSIENVYQAASPVNKPTLIPSGVKSVDKKKIIKSEKTLSENALSAKIPVKEKTVENRPYTIQVAAWKSLEEAKKDQLSLTKYGIDAYTQRAFIKNKNEYWWRVRVGNFSDFNQASKVKKQIESLREGSVWIDRIVEN